MIASEPLSNAMRGRRAVRVTALSLAALSLATACSSSGSKATVTVNATPTASSAGPSATTSPATSAAVTPQPTQKAPAPLGWPRAGWSIQSESLGHIAVYFPNSWTFDSAKGYWGDGVYTTFCNAFVDHSLNQAGAPNAKTVAETRWNAVFGPGSAANERGFTTFYGGDAWGADVTLGNGVTVEPRIIAIRGDVWIECGALTRGTAATGAEIWDIVDSFQIVDESAMEQKAWNATP